MLMILTPSGGHKWAMQQRLLKHLKQIVKNTVSCIALQGFWATCHGSVSDLACTLPRAAVESYELCPILYNKLFYMRESSYWGQTSVRRLTKISQNARKFWINVFGIFLTFLFASSSLFCFFLGWVGGCFFFLITNWWLEVRENL